MKDTFNRNISYLRLSVTDSCNFRCRYCRPSQGPSHMDRSTMLTDEEMLRVVKVASSLGVRKVRLTGGEPLVKESIVDLCRGISHMDGIQTISITTNGTRLPLLAKDLKDAGVGSVNISLDSLVEEKFHTITRTGHIEDAWNGVEAALSAGFRKIKINTVLMGGFNDDEIRPMAELTQKYPLDVRFIELMPMTDYEGFFNEGSFIPGHVVLDTLPELVDVTPDGGVAKLYKFPGAKGNIGIISPISCAFCKDCNRIRVTADGRVKPCLHSHDEFSIKGLDDEEMRKVLVQAILKKPQEHPKLDYGTLSESGRNMNEIGG